MANELKHGSVGTELTQAEWEGIGTHVFSSQAEGDIMYASSTSQLTRLGKGADNTVLHLASGIPAWSATLAGLTLTTPTISATGFANANHAHAASNSGGTLTTLGTIATGVWQGTDVGVAYGGTGVSTLAANGVLIGNGASAITSVVMTTKGHILIGDGSGNPQMLGVGTNNHVMTADSGETTGVKWAAPAAAAAGSLTGSTLASGVTASSLTSVGTLTALTVDNVAINGTTIGHTGDTDLITLASGTMTLAGTIDMGNNAISNVGVSGNDLSATSIAWNAGANTATISIQSTGSANISRFQAKVVAAGTGEVNIEFIQGSGNGDADNMGYTLGYEASNNFFHIRSEDTNGSSAGADVMRIPDGQLSLDANTTWDDNAFDDYDDAMVLSPYRHGTVDLAARRQELIAMGVLRVYYNTDGSPDETFLGYNDQRMAALLAGGIYQGRERMDAQYEELDRRLKKIGG